MKLLHMFFQREKLQLTRYVVYHSSYSKSTSRVFEHFTDLLQQLQKVFCILWRFYIISCIYNSFIKFLILQAINGIFFEIN